MKKLVVFFCLALCVWFLYIGFNYYRESQLLKSSGLDVSRLSVELIYSHERSINLGADISEIYGYKFPSDFSGVSMCGHNGYSGIVSVDVANMLNLPEIDRGEEMGCVRREVTAGGTSYIYVLLEENLFIKLM